MKLFVIFLSVVATLIFYLCVSRTMARRRWSSPDDYFVAKNSATAEEFAASQTAYALQMATIYPFFVFAFSGQFWIAALNTTFFVLGIAWYLMMIPRFTSKHTKLLGEARTVHAAIAQYNGTPDLRWITALFTCFAFAGLATFEITWGAQVFKILLGGSTIVYYFAICALAAYITCYVWMGGQRATIKTGQYQLVVAYVGLHALIAWSVWLPSIATTPVIFPPIIPIILAACAVMLLLRLRQVLVRNALPPYLKVLNLITITSLVCMMVSLAAKPGAFTLSVPHATWLAIAQTPHALLIAVSVSLLPLCFQFVDMTNWQRIAALHATPAVLVRETRQGLMQYLVESPLSWLLPILLGLFAQSIVPTTTNGSDSWQVFVEAILAVPGWGAGLIGTALCLSVVAIFVSTADELIAAVGYAFAYDVSKIGQRLTKGTSDEKSTIEIIRIGRRAMLIAAMVVGLGYVMADVFFGGGAILIGAFLACYAPLIAMAPSVIIPALSDRHVTSFWVYLSLFGGALGVIEGGITLFAPSLLGDAGTWLAPVITFFWSWIFYALGWLISLLREASADNELRNL